MYHGRLTHPLYGFDVGHGGKLTGLSRNCLLFRCACLPLLKGSVGEYPYHDNVLSKISHTPIITARKAMSRNL